MCGPRPARKQPSAIHGRAGPYARSNAKTGGNLAVSTGFGAPAGTRILGPLIKSQMLYQLSYRHVYTVVLTALLL